MNYIVSRNMGKKRCMEVYMIKVIGVLELKYFVNLIITIHNEYVLKKTKK